MRADPPYRRQRLIVNPGYQIKVTGVLALFFILFVLLALGLVHYALWSTLRALELDQEALFVSIFNAVAWMVTVELVIAIPILILLGLFLTHKVVGPVGRIKAALAQLGQGNFDVVLKLRRGDVLSDLADSINRVATSLKHKRPS